MKNRKVMLVLGLILFVFLIIECTYFFYYYRWKHLWTLEDRLPTYQVKESSADSLRVLMIGDSWAGIHHESGMDSYLQSQLQSKLKKRIVVESKGKGGEKTKGIYRLIFESNTYGTRPLFSEGADYCVVFAGINDAAANLGVRQYCYYYRLILDFLLVNHIRPVVVEIPNVNIWQIYGSKPIKDLLSDFVKSKMTNCKMYQIGEYREALHQMLQNESFMEKVIYIPMDKWNRYGPEIEKSLFMEDQIHLNRKGYEKLDSCIAQTIARDLQ